MGLENLTKICLRISKVDKNNYLAVEEVKDITQATDFYNSLGIQLPHQIYSAPSQIINKFK